MTDTVFARVSCRIFGGTGSGGGAVCQQAFHRRESEPAVGALVTALYENAEVDRHGDNGCRSWTRCHLITSSATATST